MRSIGLLLLAAVSGFVFAQDELFTLPDTRETVDVGTLPDDAFDESVTVMAIKRTPCFGTCPIYEMVLRNDGSVVYNGERYVEKGGEFTGRLAAQDYDRLAEFLVSNDLKSLADEYTVGATDLPGTWVVFVQDGEKKVIYDYGNVGPTELWVVQQLLDSMLSKVVWDE